MKKIDYKITRSLIKEDFIAWCIWKKFPQNFKGFLKCCYLHPEFVKLIDYRIKSCNNRLLHFFRLFTHFYSKHLNLYFTCKDLGGGLIIQHGFATFINCEKMGHHCWINQQVTIGRGNTGRPTIGNYVKIRCGAKVLGGINIGDDVEIGANAVVIKDIPPHSIVAGIPARIIKTRKDMSSQWEKVVD